MRVSPSAWRGCSPVTKIDSPDKRNKQLYNVNEFIILSYKVHVNGKFRYGMRAGGLIQPAIHLKTKVVKIK